MAIARGLCREILLITRPLSLSHEVCVLITRELEERHVRARSSLQANFFTIGTPSRCFHIHSPLRCSSIGSLLPCIVPSPIGEHREVISLIQSVPLARTPWGRMRISTPWRSIPYGMFERKVKASGLCVNYLSRLTLSKSCALYQVASIKKSYLSDYDYRSPNGSIHSFKKMSVLIGWWT